MLGLYEFRGCKGLQPSKSITAIEALIQTWRASGPSAPCWATEALFVAARHGPNVGSLLVFPRLEGTTVLQVNNGYRSLDAALEGARSLGAVLGDGSFVCRGKAWAQCWVFIGVPAAARDCSLWSLDVFLRPQSGLTE